MRSGIFFIYSFIKSTIHQINEGEMGKEYSTHGRNRKCLSLHNFSRKPEGKKPNHVGELRVWIQKFPD
jgi:hypothetical protein